jgi:hypothetical protein
VYPLVFGLIIILINYSSLRTHLPKSIVLGIAYCYIALLIGILTWIGLCEIFEFIGVPYFSTIGNWSFLDLSFWFGAYIITPLLTLLLLSSIFRETSTKFTNWIILITILTFGALSCVYPDQALKNYFNVINIGHLIFMFGLQLIINQKTILEKLDAKKKPAHNNGYKI